MGDAYFEVAWQPDGSCAINNYLESEYFRAGQSVIAFTWHATAGAFVYLLARRWELSLMAGFAGIFFALFFVFGAALLASNRAEAMRSRPGSTRMLGVLMFLPFVVGCAGALLGFYPYGESRHVAYLEPFAVAAIAFGIAWLSRKAVWTGIAATVALLIACNAYAEPTEYMPERDQARGLMVRCSIYAKRYPRAA